MIPVNKLNFSSIFEYSEKDYIAVRFRPGKYKIELWGAQGGHKLVDGGQGAYTSGEIIFDKFINLFIYIGSQGILDNIGGYNGGGDAPKNCDNRDYCIPSYGGSGGGATDIRLNSGNWNDTQSLKSRIMVASGGGGCSNYQNTENREVAGSPGGGLVSNNGSYSQCTLSNCKTEAEPIFIAIGASQIQGGHSDYNQSYGVLGIGGSTSGRLKGAGGGGYFGGGAGTASLHRHGSGTGGSSFISGYEGCYAFSSPNNDEPSRITNIHYSKLLFYNGIMLGGNETIPSPNGETENGHHGNGVAKITLLELFNISLYKCKNIEPLSLFVVVFIYNIKQ